jgi:DHHC palmitoyltransferase
VNKFDHHCQYLNNCIGAKNYKLFFRLIVTVFVLVFMHNLTNGFVIYGYLTENEKVNE